MVSVYLFVPNLIGYARVILALVGYAVALHHHQVTLFCYMGSQLLDAVDGLAARMLGQSSEFGLPPLSHAPPAARTLANVAAAAQGLCSTWSPTAPPLRASASCSARFTRSTSHASAR